MRKWHLGAQLTFVAVLLIVLVRVPLTTSPGMQTTILTLLMYTGLTSAWNIVGGFGGQVSLGHSVFVGIGAYTTAMLLLHSSAPLLAAVLCGGALAAVAALVSAPLLLRLQGAYFSIGTLGLALAALAWMQVWDRTGASRGLFIPFASIPSLESIYYLALVVAAATLAVSAWLAKSAFGLRVMAVRDDEQAAAGLGVPVTRTRVIAYVISALLTGLMGSVIGLNQVAITPDNLFGLDWTVAMLVMAVVGGLGTVWGPAWGAFAVYYLIQYQLQDHPVASTLLSGIILIAVVQFAPRGLGPSLGSFSRRAGATVLRAAASRRPETPAPAAHETVGS